MQLLLAVLLQLLLIHAFGRQVLETLHLPLNSLDLRIVSTALQHRCCLYIQRQIANVA